MQDSAPNGRPPSSITAHVGAGGSTVSGLGLEAVDHDQWDAPDHARALRVPSAALPEASTPLHSAPRGTPGLCDSTRLGYRSSVRAYTTKSDSRLHTPG